MQICVFSLVFQYPNYDYISVDSQRRMLYNDLIYVNVDNKIKYRCHGNLKIVNFKHFFLIGFFQLSIEQN